MPDKLTFNLLPPSSTSEYRWFNINRDDVMIGKVRGRMDGNTLTIYSIIIFPEFEGMGYGKRTIDMFKSCFDKIIADRVRPKARGFWERMEFLSHEDGSYVYRKKAGCLLQKEKLMN